MKASVCVVLLLAFVASVSAVDWAVIVAGSNGYYNYRHQADACHAYQIVAKNGIPGDRIVMMYYDDIASDPENPFPGKLFNKPTPAGTPGVDVYAGCQKDYTGNDVTAANFLAVLTGDQQTTKGKKVLKSGPSDNVFVFFTDHGGTGIIAFPVGPYLQVGDLNQALRKMNSAKMYQKLVFYMEACESGSMFENVLPKNINIYVTTASNAVESSWGCYCPPEDIINGQSLGSCLGDLYSVNWMEDADKQTPLGMKESLQDQFTVVKQLTTMSHVMQYGDVSWTNMAIGNFQGEIHSNETTTATTGLLGRTRIEEPEAPKQAGIVDSRDVVMHSLYYRYLRADKTDLEAKHEAAFALQKEIAHRVKADNVFHTLAKETVRENWGSLFTAPSTIVSSTCVNMAHQAVADHCGGFSDYSLQYTRVVYNVCAYLGHSNVAGDRVVESIRSLCSQ